MQNVGLLRQIPFCTRGEGMLQRRQGQANSSFRHSHTIFYNWTPICVLISAIYLNLLNISVSFMLPNMIRKLNCCHGQQLISESNGMVTVKLNVVK